MPVRPETASRCAGSAATAATKPKPRSRKAPTTASEQAEHLSKARVVGSTVWKCVRKPRTLWGRMPRGRALASTRCDSGVSGSASAAPPAGWCRSATSNSTASADATGARPGRDTVHCWSSVRSFEESLGAMTSLQK